MMRSMTQIRPKGDPTALPYAPQRDLANIYLPMLREVFNGLESENLPPFYKELFMQFNVTDVDIGQAVTVMTDAHTYFIRDQTVSSPADAFAKAGVGAIHPAIQHALFSRIGEVLTGGFFVALRDITLQGQQSPAYSTMAEMVAAGRQLSDRLSGRLADHPIDEVEQLRAMLNQNEQLISQLQRLLDSMTQAASHSAAVAAAAAPLVKFETDYKAGGILLRLRSAAYAVKQILSGKPL